MIFYTTHCPKCRVLEIKLKQKGIQYVEIEDVELMKQKGITSAPAIEYNNEIYDFVNAVKLVNNF